MNPAKLHLGTIGWSYNFWKGPFYPKKTSSKDFLNYYGSQFGTVEVDSTFYRLPTESTVENWKQQTPKGFMFALKFPSQITHVKRLIDAQVMTDAFLARSKLLGEKLGPLLLQLPPTFTIDHFEALERYLHALPQGDRYVVEVRHNGWLKKDFYDLLHGSNVALAWTVSPLNLQISEVTADFLYVRLEGDRTKVNGLLGKIEADVKADLAVWAQKLKRFLDADVEVFGYFGKYYSGLPPSDVAYLSSLLKEG
jgi:uncharacterized protein YecE (DUF72 family)